MSAAPHTYGTATWRVPDEPPPGTVVVPLPDRGGPFWTRDDTDPARRWAQSMSGDHRRVTWIEVLGAAGGAVQQPPDSRTGLTRAEETPHMPTTPPTPNPAPRPAPLSWPTVVALLGTLALVLAAVCFLAWLALA